MEIQKSMNDEHCANLHIWRTRSPWALRVVSSYHYATLTLNMATFYQSLGQIRAGVIEKIGENGLHCLRK